MNLYYVWDLYLDCFFLTTPFTAYIICLLLIYMLARSNDVMYSVIYKTIMQAIHLSNHFLCNGNNYFIFCECCVCKM